MAGFLGVRDPAEVIWTRGTTEAINLVAATLGPANVGEGDHIVLTMLEHHSNVVPWQLLARRVRSVSRAASVAIHSAFGTQILLGIATVMTGIAFSLAVLHQAVGALVVASAVWGAYLLGRRAA